MLLCDPARARNNNLDFLRFVFAVMVIFSHSFPIMGHDAAEPLRWLTHGGYSFGGTAVKGFFLISGYLIAASWLHDPTLKKFLARRVLRIYPGFLVVSLVCYGLVAPLASDSLAAYVNALHPITFLRRALCLQQPLIASAFVHTNLPFMLSGSLWTILYEFGCYLLVAIVGLAGMFKNRAVFAAVAGALCVIAEGFTLRPAGLRRLPEWTHSLTFDMLACLWFVSAFSVGCAFYLYRDRLPRSPLWLGLSFVGMAVCIVKPGLISLLLPVCMAYATFWFAFGTRYDLAAFTTRTGGDLSYGLYLYAWPVQMLLSRWLGAYLNPYTLFALTFPLTAVLAKLSWRYVEQPALKRKPRAAAQ